MRQFVNRIGLMAGLIILIIHSVAFAEGVDEYTKLLIQSETTNPSSPILDRSNYRHSIIYSPGGQHNTEIAKFGNSSIDAYSQKYSESHQDYYIGSQNFTVDFWIYFPANYPYREVTLFRTTEPGSQTNYKSTELRYLREAGQFYFVSNQPDGNIIFYWIGTALQTQMWHHIAFVRNGEAFMLYVNGNLLGSRTDPRPIHNGGGFFYIVDSHPQGTFIEEYRLSVGIARWAGPFTPPTEPYRANLPPVANAGADQGADYGTTVTLDGTGSTDPEGDPMSYSWEIVSKPEKSVTVLTNPTSTKPTLVPDLVGEYEIQLTVTDLSSAVPSVPDRVKIIAEPLYIMVGNDNRLVISKNGNVGIGIHDPQQKLSVNGAIMAREVRVTLDGWADYVFDDAYNLRPLSEVEEYINQFNHLPDMPSADQVKDEGIRVSAILEKQMQKIEELTLYMIELNNHNEKLSERIQRLEKK